MSIFEIAREIAERIDRIEANGESGLAEEIKDDPYAVISDIVNAEQGDLDRDTKDLICETAYEEYVNM